MSKKDTIVFHFNKHHLVDPTVPMWIVKHKGKTHYVDHLDSNVGFSTKETPDNPHTKGSLKFKGRLTFETVNNKLNAIIN